MKRLIQIPALSFDDVLLEPQWNRLKSRSEVNINSFLGNRLSIVHPILATNMTTVTGPEMIMAMAKTGSFAIPHRFQSYEDIIRDLKISHEYGGKCVFPLGVQDKDFQICTDWGIEQLIHDLRPAHLDGFLIDIAHGYSEYVLNMVSNLRDARKRLGEDFVIMAGNIATYQSAVDMLQAGANVLRVGIGGSRICTTRKTTGHGLPTLQSIIEVADAIKKEGYDQNAFIIADGGFREPGDIVKAIAAGAHAVTLGTMLAATSASPAGLIKRGDTQYKICYGMASKMAQENHEGQVKPRNAPEGIDLELPYAGDTVEYVNMLCDYIKSGCTYSGASNLDELQDKATFRVITSNGARESKLA